MYYHNNRHAIIGVFYHRCNLHLNNFRCITQNDLIKKASLHTFRNGGVIMSNRRKGLMSVIIVLALLLANVVPQRYVAAAMSIQQMKKDSVVYTKLAKGQL